MEAVIAGVGVPFCWASPGLLWGLVLDRPSLGEWNVEGFFGVSGSCVIATVCGPVVGV
ncbi:hypothetical protein [Rubritalea tangerina]|uniref:hypothetical protein n=1 Tax=Rubritalea tangerina TaxID=430798 RepID=UPI00361354EF